MDLHVTNSAQLDDEFRVRAETALDHLSTYTLAAESDPLAELTLPSLRPEPLLDALNPRHVTLTSPADLAQLAFSCYGEHRGKIAVYRSESDPKSLTVVIAGTEVRLNGAQSNTPFNWLSAGSGRLTDLELQVEQVLRDLYLRGEIEDDVSVNLVGHSLGGIVANNLTGGDEFDRNPAGKVRVRLADRQLEFPVQEVTSFGTPTPARWSNDPLVSYTQYNGAGDIVANLPVEILSQEHRSHLRRHLSGPLRYTEHIVDVNVQPFDPIGGHNNYARHSSALRNLPLPEAFQQNQKLELLAAYTAPASLGHKLDAPMVSRIIGLIPRFERLAPPVQYEIIKSISDFSSDYLEGTRWQFLTQQSTATLTEVVDAATILTETITSEIPRDLFHTISPEKGGLLSLFGSLRESSKAAQTIFREGTKLISLLGWKAYHLGDLGVKVLVGVQYVLLPLIQVNVTSRIGENVTKLQETSRRQEFIEPQLESKRAVFEGG